LPAYKFVSFDPVQNLDHWDFAEEAVPSGSREKKTLIDPENGGHFIFKYPNEKRDHQIWSELLASFIAGDLFGWDVQTTSIAVLNGRIGNLLGYVYEPGTKTAAQEVFIEGWSLCAQVDPDYDLKRGTRHTLPLLMRVCDEILVSTYGMDRNVFMDFWAKALALDALISNTDRHAENWAVVQNSSTIKMAALYDNGSSLGCGLDTVGLGRAFDGNGKLKDSHLDRQRSRGRHHLRLDAPSKDGGLFEDVCEKFLAGYPEGRRWFEVAEGVDIEAVCDLMASISRTSDLAEPYFLSERRQQHICAMLQIGAERIRNVLSKR